MSAAFADYQIDPYAMYFALLDNKTIGKGTEMKLVQDEDGNYVIVDVPFGPDFSTHTASEGEWTLQTYEVPTFGGHFEFVDGRWTWVQNTMEVNVPEYTTYVWYAYSAEQLAEYAQAIQDVQDALDAYNEKVADEIEDENERIEAYNNLVAAYNEAVDAYNEALASYMNALQRRTAAKNFAVALNLYPFYAEDEWEDEDGYSNYEYNDGTATSILPSMPSLRRSSSRRIRSARPNSPLPVM